MALVKKILLILLTSFFSTVAISLASKNVYAACSLEYKYTIESPDNSELWVIFENLQMELGVIEVDTGVYNITQVPNQNEAVAKIPPQPRPSHDFGFFDFSLYYFQGTSTAGESCTGDWPQLASVLPYSESRDPYIIPSNPGQAGWNLNYLGGPNEEYRCEFVQQGAEFLNREICEAEETRLNNRKWTFYRDESLDITYCVPVENTEGLEDIFNSKTECQESISAGGGPSNDKNPCKFDEEQGQVVCETALGDIPTNPQGFATKILRIATALAGGIALILMVIGAIRVLTSSGDQQKLAAGRDQIVAATAGLLFLIFSVLILKFIGVSILGF